MVCPEKTVLALSPKICGSYISKNIIFPLSDINLYKPKHIKSNWMIFVSHLGFQIFPPKVPNDIFPNIAHFIVMCSDFYYNLQWTYNSHIDRTIFCTSTGS